MCDKKREKDPRKKPHCKLGVKSVVLNAVRTFQKKDDWYNLWGILWPSKSVMPKSFYSLHGGEKRGHPSTKLEKY